MKMESIIKADNLYFTYDGENTPALNGLSLDIQKGKKIAVMGANGSGKSTFFLCLNGILKPQKGTLSFCGTPYSYDRKSLLELRHRIGIVFQDPDNQLFSASVLQEISFGILNLGADSETALKETEKIMDALDITELKDRPEDIVAAVGPSICRVAWHWSIGQENRKGNWGNLSFPYVDAVCGTGSIFWIWDTERYRIIFLSL